MASRSGHTGAALEPRKCKQSVSKNLACSEHAADLVAIVETRARRSNAWAPRAQDDSTRCSNVGCRSMKSSVIRSRQLSFPVETPPVPVTSEGRRGGHTRSETDSATPPAIAAPASVCGARTQANGTYLPAPTSMLLTVRDVAVALRLGRTRTYALLRSGEIPVIRVGRAVRVPRDGLHRWIEEHCTSVDQASSGNGFESR
jgi:excisionase family DNA binding protein